MIEDARQADFHATEGWLHIVVLRQADSIIVLYLREVEVIQEVHELAVARWTKVCAGFLLQGQSHRILFSGTRRTRSDVGFGSMEVSITINVGFTPYVQCR